MAAAAFGRKPEFESDMTAATVHDLSQSDERWSQSVDDWLASSTVDEPEPAGEASSDWGAVASGPELFDAEDISDLVPASDAGEGDATSRLERDLGENRAFYVNRAFRGVSAWLLVLYFLISEQMLVAVACTKIGSAYYVVSQHGQQCFTTEHSLAFAVATVLLFLAWVVTPVGLCIVLDRRRHALVDPTVRARFGLLFEHVRKRSRSARPVAVILELFTLIVLALSSTVLRPLSAAQLSLIVVTLVMRTAIALALRLYRHGLDRVVAVLSTAALLLVVLINFLLDTEQLPGDDDATRYLLVVALSVIVLTAASYFVFALMQALTSGRLRESLRMVENRRNLAVLAKKTL